MKRFRVKRFGGRTPMLLAFFIAAGVLGFLMLQKYRAPHPPLSPPATNQPPRNSTVTLFFDSADATGLVGETRDVASCPGDTPSCIKVVLESLAAGPVGNLAPVIPPTSTFNGVRLDGPTATVDLGTSFIEGLPEGSAAEMTAVYALVNTVTFNFPAVKNVKLLLNGQELKTLNGHLDLSKPLEPDFTLGKKSN
jgi:hypothetical protein